MTLTQFIFDVLVAALAHELGHIICAWCFGVPIKKVSVNWKGIYVRRARTVGRDEVAICLAGAAINFELAIAFAHFHWFAICNLVFALVNLLPIPNSDGRHAWQALGAMRWQPRVCELCGYTLVLREDLDYHGLGNCVLTCWHCNGSGRAFAGKCVVCAGCGHIGREF